jgi:FMN-dependent NADH-azoreductase
MSKVLLVTSSPRGDASHSKRIARTLVDQLASGDPKSTVTVRDLFKEPLPHIGEDFVGALFAPPENHTPAQSAAFALSDKLIAELFAADVIVIASSMINFGISSTLKTYIDYVLRKGVTFRYTENGPEGLVKGKKAYIVRASGGVYTEGAAKPLNFQDPYLKVILGFIGITDVETIHIEGIAYGPEATDKALAAAAAHVATVRPHHHGAAAAA